jgi:hypothetical protein
MEIIDTGTIYTYNNGINFSKEADVVMKKIMMDGQKQNVLITLVSSDEQIS